MNQLLAFYGKWKEYIRVDIIMYLSMIMFILTLLVFFS